MALDSKDVIFMIFVDVILDSRCKNVFYIKYF